MIDAFANALQLTFTIGAAFAAVAIVALTQLPRALR